MITQYNTLFFVTAMGEIRVLGIFDENSRTIQTSDVGTFSKLIP